MWNGLNCSFSVLPVLIWPTFLLKEYLYEQLSNEGSSEEGTESIQSLNLTSGSKKVPGFDPFEVHRSYCTDVLEKVGDYLEHLHLKWNVALSWNTVIATMKNKNPGFVC